MKIRHFLAILIASTIFCPATAYAADEAQIQSAWSLYSLGLFSGTGVNDDGTPIFNLDENITRAQAVTLLVNLMGKSTEAEAGHWTTPFSDLPQWAEKYVGYAYTMGYTSGVSSNLFEPDIPINANQFNAIVLRALGYTETSGDFDYQSALDFASEKGLSQKSYKNFTRGDAAEISLNALSQKMNNSSYTLYDILVNSGTVSAPKASIAPSSETSEPKSDSMSAEEIYEKCSPAVFYIEVYNSSGKAIQLGSGFFISPDGTAVTNYHVLEGGSSAKITLSDTNKVYDVTGVYDYDVERDLALIKIDGSGFSYLDTADSDDIKGGATVYAIGSPLGLSNTISQGIISNTSRSIEGQEYIQISAAISSGSSGGALINSNGEVIGITSGEATHASTSGTVTGQNLNLAIPINYISLLKKDSITAMADIYSYEIHKNAVIEVSSDNIVLEKGKSTAVVISCQADVPTYLTGSLAEEGIVSAKFTSGIRNSMIYITAIKSGSTEINLKMRASDKSVIAEKVINITVN